MADFTLLAAQVRAARALLGWSQGYLAEGINVRRATIADFEDGKHEPHHGTLAVLMKELAAAGIVFTDTGVEFRKWPPVPYVPTGIATTQKRLRRTLHPKRSVSYRAAR
jgi:DNA-binding XRE family transcriptional regulator